MSIKVYSLLWQKKQNIVSFSGITNIGKKIEVNFTGFKPYFYFGLRQYYKGNHIEILNEFTRRQKFKRLIDRYKFSFNFVTEYKISNGFSYGKPMPMLKINCPTFKSHSLLINILKRITDTKIMCKNKEYKFGLYNVFKDEEEILFAHTFNLNTVGWNEIIIDGRKNKIIEENPHQIIIVSNF